MGLEVKGPNQTGDLQPLNFKADVTLLNRQGKEQII